MDLHTFAELRAPMPTMRAIAERVAQKHGIKLTEIRGPGRTRHLAYARFEAFWLCRQEMRGEQHRWALPTIGRYFGGRDHTTVLHGVRKHEELLAMREAAE